MNIRASNIGDGRSLLVFSLFIWIYAAGDAFAIQQAGRKPTRNSQVESRQTKKSPVRRPGQNGSSKNPQTPSKIPGKSSPVPRDQAPTPLPSLDPEIPSTNVGPGDATKPDEASATEINSPSKATLEILDAKSNPLQVKNLLYEHRLGINDRSALVLDLLTGLNVNQSTRWLNLSNTAFAPEWQQWSWTNWLGLELQAEWALAQKILGRDVAAGETLSLQSAGWAVGVGPTLRIQLPFEKPARFWVNPMSYTYRKVSLKISSGAALGSGTQTVVQSGLMLVAGGDYSFLPYLHTGADVFWGYDQTYKASDQLSGLNHSGDWNFFEPRMRAELRYPLLWKGKPRVVSVQAAAGLRLEYFKSKAPEISLPGQKNSSHFSVSAGVEWEP